MKHTLLGLLTLLFLTSCGSSKASTIDTTHEVLSTIHTSASALYQTLGDLCDERERRVVESDMDKELAQQALNDIRHDCDSIMRPLLDVVEGSEKVDQAIDLPWVREGL